MLRIAYAEEGSEQRWTLHGQLAGPWTEELKSFWNKNRQANRARALDADIIVDLRDVSFIDESGEAVLRAMKREGARFCASGVDTRDILGRLDTRAKAPFRKCLSFMYGDAAYTKKRK